jgi:hypothetical protein
MRTSPWEAMGFGRGRTGERERERKRGNWTEGSRAGAAFLILKRRNLALLSLAFWHVKSNRFALRLLFVLGLRVSI